LPTTTYTPLANITVTSNTSNVSFNNIPNTYRDLIVIYSYRSTGDASLLGQLNSDSGSNYPQIWLQNSGSSTRSENLTRTGYEAGYNSTSGVTFFGQLAIMDYSTTDKHKTAVLRAASQTPDEIIARVMRWANTAAVTSLRFACTGQIAAGSTFSLYGVVA